MTRPNMPYFDKLLASIEGRTHAELVETFGTRHVHWGYYHQPEQATNSMQALAAASEALTLRMLDLAEIADGQGILDAGSGFGGTCQSLNERFNQLRVTGLNIDSRQVARARELVKPRFGNQIAFVEGDACDMPFGDRSFDRMLAVECIFHFSSRRRFLAEARRVLRPGGHLVLSDFVPYGPALPLFAPWAALRGSRITSFYGHSNPLPCTSTVYRLLAKTIGLTLTVDEDVTKHTLPTYDALLTMFRRLNEPIAEEATLCLKWLSHWGLLRYRLLKFTAG